MSARGFDIPASRSRLPASVLAAALLAGLAAIGLGSGPAPVLAQDPWSDLYEPLGLDEKVVVVGSRRTTAAPPGNFTGQNVGQNDLIEVEYVLVEMVDERIFRPFNDCNDMMTICSQGGSRPESFMGHPALIFRAHVGAPLDTLDPTRRYEFGPQFALPEYPAAPLQAGNPFSGTSHDIISRVQGEMHDVLYFAFQNGQFNMFRADPRSKLVDRDVFTIIDLNLALQRTPLRFGYYTYSSDGTEAGTGWDSLQGSAGGELPGWQEPPVLEFGAVEPSAAPSTEPSAEPSGSTGPGASASTAPSASTGPSPTPGGSTGGGMFEQLTSWVLFWPLVYIVGGLALVLVAFWLLFGRRRKKPEAGPPPSRPPDSKPGSTPPGEPPKPGGPMGPGGPVDPGTPEPPIPPGPPPPPPPPPKACEDGDIEWRQDKPPGRFWVLRTDSKVAITADPTTPELEAWVASFGPPRGVPAVAFYDLDDAALDALLAGLAAGPMEIHWSIAILVDEIGLQCERKWVCKDNVYVATAETRLLQAGPTEQAARWTVDGPSRTRADIERIWAEAKKALLAGSGSEAAMDAYRRNCR